MKQLIKILFITTLFLGISYAKTNITYLGDQDEQLSLGFTENFTKYNNDLQTIFLETKKSLSEEEILNQLTINKEQLKKSNTIIINSDNFDSIFQTIEKINNNNELQLQKKDIYLITDTNKFFLKRILSQYIKLIGGEKIYTLPKDQFLNFMSDLSFNKITKQEKYITMFSLAFEERSKIYIISYIIDNLISNGFPIELIGIILILSISTLIISIFRQIIGFSVFGIYSPLLFGLSMSVIGIPMSLGLFIIGMIAKYLTNVFCKKFYLLHNAKTTMLVVLYFLLNIIIIGIDQSTVHMIKLDIFTSILSLFPLLFVIIVTDKVCNDGFKLLSVGRWISIIEFFIVSISVWRLLHWSGLKHFVLSYPEIIIIIIILNIIIGRFTGLQLLEYFRFMPMIKKHLEGEEE